MRPYFLFYVASDILKCFGIFLHTQKAQKNTHICPIVYHTHPKFSIKDISRNRCVKYITHRMCDEAHTPLRLSSPNT